MEYEHLTVRVPAGTKEKLRETAEKLDLKSTQLIRYGLSQVIRESSVPNVNEDDLKKKIILVAAGFELNSTEEFIDWQKTDSKGVLLGQEENDEEIK